MKAYLKIALLVIFIIGINGDVTLCENVKGEDEDTCILYPTSENYTHCCYVELNDDKRCRQLSDDQYENVKRYKDFLKSQGYTDIKIKCVGEFLTYSLLVLLALMF